MIRSAAKNHARVTVVCDPADYEARCWRPRADGRGASPAARAELAAKAFAHTAAYDAAIAATYRRARTGSARSFPLYLTLPFERAYGLRYGENPHQSGAFYVERDAPAGSLARAESLGVGRQGAQLQQPRRRRRGARRGARVRRPAAVVVKHTNPCGVAVASALDEAYRTARDADPVSAFGGIVALNRGG